MDSGLVYILDTAYGPDLFANMSRRDQRGGQDVVLLVYKGIVIYNGKMGGVDAWDAIRTGYFAVEMMGRSAKWTCRFVDSLFNIQLTQGWIVYRHIHDITHNEYKNDRALFQALICQAFLDNTEDDKRRVSTRLAEVDDARMKFGKHHHQVNSSVMENKSRADGKSRLMASACAYCSTLKPADRLIKNKYNILTTYSCQECSVPLHVDCFAEYHNSALPTL